jgi:hypothetical protein
MLWVGLGNTRILTVYVSPGTDWEAFFIDFIIIIIVYIYCVYKLYGVLLWIIHAFIVTWQVWVGNHMNFSIHGCTYQPENVVVLDWSCVIPCLMGLRMVDEYFYALFFFQTIW